MNVAVDYDGTIADTNAEKAQWIKKNLHRDDVPSWLCNYTECMPIIGRTAYKDMGDFVYERESTLFASEVPGALSTLHGLVEAGHNVFLVTARPDDRLRYAAEWLFANNAHHLLMDVLSSHGSTKADVCKRIEAQVLIDDDPRHLKNLQVCGLHGILLQHNRPDIPATAKGNEFCRCWSEAERAIQRLHPASHRT